MPRSEYTGQAFGKIILFGEHAVVHGCDAVGVGLTKGARVRATPRPGPSTLFIQNWNRTITAGDGSGEGTALYELLHALGAGTEGIGFFGLVDIPSRSGLGSSAAVAAATARAARGLENIRVTRDHLFESVQASEKVFHGNPSGLDAAMALHGGGAIFSRSKGLRTLEIPPLPLLVIHSKERGDTSHTVAQFAKVLEEDVEQGISRLDRFSQVAESGIEALRRKDLASVGKAMTANHELLARFGVSSPNLDRIVDLAIQSGALGAKLTGGGGGGCAIVLTKPQDTLVAAALNDAGFSEVNVG